MSQSDLDFSVRGAPTSWTEGQVGSTGVSLPGRKSQQHRLVKAFDRERPADAVVGIIVGLLAAAISGASMAAIELRDFNDINPEYAPWLAIPAAVFIALVIRLGAGRGGRDTRAMIGACIYLLMLLATTYYVARHDYLMLYRTTPSIDGLDRWFRTNRLNNVFVMLNWVMGFLVVIQASFLMGKRQGIRHW